jgi:drug/metabolite transporter (DMT)-like permease
MQRKTGALLRNLGAVVCWSVAPLMIRATREHYSVLFQTFARYLCSLAVLWPVLLASGGRGRARRDFRAILPLLPRILVIALVNYAFQTTYTVAYYTLLPGFAALVNQSGVLFAVALALFFFPDERRTLRNRVFLGGLVCAVAGVLVTILAGGLPSGGAVAAGEAGSPLLGVLAMLASAFSWALLGTLVKKWLHDVNPLFALSAVFTIVTPLFLLTDVIAAGGLALPRAPPAVWAVLVLSGLIGVGLGHSLYYSAVPQIGVTVSSSLGLLVPLLAGLMSFFVFGERLGPLRLLGAALVLGGCFVVIRERFRSTA